MGLRLELGHWVNDALMTVFFLVIGLEVKRELTIGRLRHPGRAKAFLLALAGLGGDGPLRCGDAGPSAQRGLPPMTGPAPHQPGGYRLRPATGSDVTSVAALVDAAYGHYVQRIGMLPRPMADDYGAVIRDRQVTVAEQDDAIVGVVVLTVTGEGFLVDNVAVHPSRRGTGLGRALLEFAEAEAQRAGFDAFTCTPTSR